VDWQNRKPSFKHPGVQNWVALYKELILVCEVAIMEKSMEQFLITETKNYLVLKIPLKAIKKRRISVVSDEKAAILEGLKAFKKKQVSKTFNNAGEAITFLRNL
jgi:hypothetical protein